LRRLYTFILFFLFLIPSITYASSTIDYSKKWEVKQFINHLHKEFGYNRKHLIYLFKKIRKNPQIPSKLCRTSVPPKKGKEGSWDRYIRIHTGKEHIDLGIQFSKKHYKALDEAYKTYGVPPEYITAIIGIETYYGNNCGRYYVFDQLTHLAFKKDKRKKFYQAQLEEFLRMCFKEKINPKKVKGSSSGAIGLAQFMPSNYPIFGVDLNGDGKIRLNTPADAIGSIANYFKKCGWIKDMPVAVKTDFKGKRFYGLKTGFKYKYKQKYIHYLKPNGYFNYKKEVMLIKLSKASNDEIWFGSHNFYVITRYNHSSYYAMAVHQLAQKIKWRSINQLKKSKEK
jgi:membrane-bound lytic murein transglycosylase B